ncbi:MAG: metal-dependent hydrolase [Pirellulaceae bacterium]|nr:metal-dependent hydrolase [Pirellulaceae bacterium]
MTTFEHAMIGVNGALAAGLHRRYGWKIVAFSGVVAVSPDWDGLTMMAGMTTFNQAHRVWGHNFLVAVLVGICLGTLDYRFDFATRMARAAMRIVKRDPQQLTMRAAAERRPVGWFCWLMVGVLTALSHLLADLVYSGGYGLPDWELKLLWPFSNEGFVYPMIPWGDPGVTIVFVVGMFAMVRLPTRIQSLAGGALLLMVAYVVLRGFTR